MADTHERRKPTANLGLCRLVAVSFVAFAGSTLPARAQYVPGEFPTGVPGYGEEMGVTVVSRIRPLYIRPGARFGDFILHGNLDESVGYNSNVVGLSGGKGSPVIETSPRLELHSDWSRDALGVSLSADRYNYPSDVSQNQTNWTVGIGGGYTINRTNLMLSYAHLQLHESPTSIGAPPSTTPISLSVDDVRLAYPFDLGRLRITPNFDASLWRYSTATINGITSSQTFRDTNEYRGGAAFKYALTGGTSLILTAQAIRSDFTHRLFAAPSLSSTSELALGGIDFQYNGIWRYQALVGIEVREFDAAQFHTRVAPIARAAAIWTPDGLTTVTATLLRTIENPTQAETSGYAYTATELRVDHEYARNLLLDAKVGSELASYLQNGGTQAAIYAGTGATWLLNRHMRVGVSYTYTTQNGLSHTTPVGGGLVATTSTSGYNQNLALVTLYIGL